MRQRGKPTTKTVPWMVILPDAPAMFFDALETASKSEVRSLAKGKLGIKSHGRLPVGTLLERRNRDR